MQYIQNSPQTFQDITDLPLFHEAIQQEITYSQVIKPVSKVIEAAITKPEPEEKEIQEVRKILGSAADGLSTQQIKNIITEIQFLVTTWLDEYEQSIFKGKTLAEVLHEKGGL